MCPCKDHNMANLQPHFDAERPNTVAALGLRWAALRGMLGSPLIEADEHRSLREELVQELQSIGRSISDIAARNAVELCAKIDLLGEEIRKASGSENDPTEVLLASIRNDVMSLLPRALVEQRSTVQIVRGAASTRAEPASAEGSRSGQA
jgi:hypothetical protein